MPLFTQLPRGLITGNRASGFVGSRNPSAHEKSRSPNTVLQPSKQLTVGRLLLLVWDEPKLLHDAQVIVALPLLGYFAVLDAVYGDTFDLYLLASRRAKLL